MKNRFVFWARSLFGNIFVLSPMIIATYFIYSYGKGSNTLAMLNEIQGNEYTINNILLCYIIAGYAVILLGLVSYLISLHKNIFDYSSSNRMILVLNIFCSALLGLLAIALIGYFAYVYMASSGFVTNNSKIFHMKYLYNVNKYLSLCVFFVFLIVDLSMLWSHKIKMKESSDELSDNLHIKGIKKNIDHSLNNIRFAWNSTWYINIPTLILTLLVILFSDSIISLTRFKNFVDQSFRFSPEIPGMLNETFYNLFVEGLETGVIISIIIISQFIFIVLKIRWGTRFRRIEIG